MALLQGLNIARNNLSVASNNYAKIQNELNKYNKIFETYAHASPETQIRAASVMRQALNEYNSLKVQQENNALKIYEAQQWMNYYNNTPSQVKVTPQTEQTKVMNTELEPTLPQVEIDTGTYEEEQPVVEETPVLNNTTPGSSDVAYVNTASTQSAQNEATLNAIKNSKTYQYFVNLGKQNKVKTNTYTPPKQGPLYPNTTISPVTSSWNRNLRQNTYGQGNIVGINTGTLNTGLRFPSSTRRTK